MSYGMDQMCSAAAVVIGAIIVYMLLVETQTNKNNRYVTPGQCASAKAAKLTSTNTNDQSKAAYIDEEWPNTEHACDTQKLDPSAEAEILENHYNEWEASADETEKYTKQRVDKSKFLSLVPTPSATNFGSMEMPTNCKNLGCNSSVSHSLYHKGGARREFSSQCCVPWGASDCYWNAMSAQNSAFAAKCNGN